MPAQTAPPPPDLDALPADATLDADAVSALLSCSPRHVHRQAAAGSLPAPLRIGTLSRCVPARCGHGCAARRAPPMPDAIRLHAASLASKSDAPADPLDRERLIGRAEYQRLLGIAQSTFERLLARERVLPPIALSRTCHRWRLGDVLDWLRDGCPDPAEWLQRRR